MTGCDRIAPKAPRGNGRRAPQAPHLDAPVPAPCRVSAPEDAETFVTEWVLCDATPPSAGAASAPAR